MQNDFQKCCSLFWHDERKINMLVIFSYSFWNMLIMYQNHFDVFSSITKYLSSVRLYQSYAVWICSEKMHTHIWHLIFTSMYSYFLCKIRYYFQLSYIWSTHLTVHRTWTMISLLYCTLQCHYVLFCNVQYSYALGIFI